MIPFVGLPLSITNVQLVIWGRMEYWRAILILLGIEFMRIYQAGIGTHIA